MRTRPSASWRSTRTARRSRRSTQVSSEEALPSVAEEQPPEPSEGEQELVEQLQAVYTISSLGYHRLSGENKDLEQARLAIEALKALLPVLEGAVPAEAVRDFNQVLANMQLAYASAAAEEHEGTD